MHKNFFKLIGLCLLPLFIFTSCSLKSVTGSEDVSSLMEKMAKKASDDHKQLGGRNDFDSLVTNLVEKTSSKLKRYILEDEVVLVSDFVNIDKLENRSKLGFLLSEHLKNELLGKNIIVRQVELGENFTLGRGGFNLLTREQKRVSNKEIEDKFAFVGTYTITSESLIVFVKLINITNGNILASANSRTSIDDEILELEGLKKQKELVLPPRMVL